MTHRPSGARWLEQLASLGAGQGEQRRSISVETIVRKAQRRRSRRAIAVTGVGLAAAVVVALVGYSPRTEVARSPDASPFASPAFATEVAAERASARRRPLHRTGNVRRVVGPADASVTHSTRDGSGFVVEKADESHVIVSDAEKPAAAQRSKRARESEEPHWRRRLREEGPAAVLQMTDADEWRAFLGQASATELLAMVRVARARRDVERARDGLMSVRERFADAPAAGHATFLLARVELELGGDAMQATRWFERYVAEFPNGPLVAQARGRALKYFVDVDDTTRARALAGEYLAHHADGPYANLARQTVERD